MPIRRPRKRHVLNLRRNVTARCDSSDELRMSVATVIWTNVCSAIMDYTASLSSILAFAAVEYLVHVIRYALGGGLLFLVFWVWKAEAWSHLRIQQKPQSRARLLHELRTSLTSLAMFTL